MDAVLRGAAIYLFLLVLFRIAGRRTFSEMTSFDFVLLLVIGEATQQALLGDDFSVTNAFIVIITLIGIDILFSMLKNHLPWLDKVVEGQPMIVVGAVPGELIGFVQLCFLDDFRVLERISGGNHPYGKNQCQTQHASSSTGILRR